MTVGWRILLVLIAHWPNSHPASPASSAAPSTASSRALPSESTWLRSTDARCVLFHESTDGKLSPNRWQFQGYPWKPGTGLSGSPGVYPPATQDHYAYVLYLQRGWEPWLADYGVCDLT